MGILDTVATAASGPLAPLISVGGKILERVIPDPAAAEAAKTAAEAGAGAIRVVLQREGAGLLMAVRSAGAPVPPEIERHLFEPFFSTRSRGSGLGLYICRELCERHGASIDYRQHPPSVRHRNEFFLTMPVEQPGSAANAP